MLQRNLPGKIAERRKNEYQFYNRKVKELVKKSKVRGDKEFGRKLNEKVIKNNL